LARGDQAGMRPRPVRRTRAGTPGGWRGVKKASSETPDGRQDAVPASDGCGVVALGRQIAVLT